MTNRKLGNAFEREFCEYLASKGFWVHNFAQNKDGQPADVIAVRNGRAYLIDCKVCSDDRFDLSRVEENQALSMRKWEETGNKTGFFALKMGKDIFMLPMVMLQQTTAKNASITHNVIRQYAFYVEEWVRVCG